MLNVEIGIQAPVGMTDMEALRFFCKKHGWTKKNDKGLIEFAQSVVANQIKEDIYKQRLVEAVKKLGLK